MNKGSVDAVSQNVENASVRAVSNGKEASGGPLGDSRNHWKTGKNAKAET